MLEVLYINDISHSLVLCLYLVSFLHRSTLADHDSLLFHVLHVTLHIILVLDVIASDLTNTMCIYVSKYQSINLLSFPERVPNRTIW